MVGVKPQVTEDGLEALKKELAVLLEQKRPKVVERLANARSQGDLSENSDYQNAREELEFLDGRINELGEVIKNARVVTSQAVSGAVDIGKSVKVRVGNREMVFFIVGEWEANPSEKKISLSSPLGQALMGKKKGDKIRVEAPAGTVVYEVLTVE